MARAVSTLWVDFPDVRDEYAALWSEMVIHEDKVADVDWTVARIIGDKEAYLNIERRTSVPWFVVAVIHSLEAGGDFSRHLHNGDPLTARTVNVPEGRPPDGEPPFSWEDSAVDALEIDGLNAETDWSVQHVAYCLEGFNGWGYREYHSEVKSPYLWSFSNHYVCGKYVADGTWDGTAVSAQCGAMVLLRRLQDAGEIELVVADYN
ncbi:hypothetical protein ACNO8X_21165 [Mycobacterium sp. PDNC021]|uniref:hypothetical protein n=1 Tax=Mycobacterium sp. PDNC021 TaxID=3391399 RepID=UPI003AAC782C